MVSMLASSSRAMVSSRRCCWVLAMSGRDGLTRVLPGLEEPSGLDRFAVAVAERAVAEDDRAVDAGRDDRRVVAVHHAGEVAVEGHLLLVVLVHRRVQSCRV